MSNRWVEHVRKFAKDNNMTYMCAITEASKTYKKTKDDELKSTPKMTTKAIPKVKKQKEEEEEEEDVDKISNDLQQLMFKSGNEKIKKALVKLNYKGRLQTNPILRNIQIIQNFNSTKKMKELIKELKGMK
jgi:FKBP-type peptidyl-prolyl cis-trans isomerase